MVGGRLISTFKLTTAVQVGGSKVQLVELPMPKQGSHYEKGFEHAEFVVGEDVNLDEFAGLYPDLVWDRAGMKKDANKDIRLVLQDEPSISIKFHQLPLDVVIERELLAINNT